VKRIEITVGPKGETQIETKSFAGVSCLQASKFLEQALGQSTSDQLTPEFSHTDTTHSQTEKER
jgi:hypothetical protein